MSLQTFEEPREARNENAHGRKQGRGVLSVASSAGPSAGAPGTANSRYCAEIQALFNQSPRVSLQRRKADALSRQGRAATGPAPPIQRTRSLSSKDIEGYSSVYQKIGESFDVDKTLVVSVGRSPQVLTKYLELRGMRVVYMPISGLSGKTMTDYEGLTTEEQGNRDAYFGQFIDSSLEGMDNIVTVDVGVSGSSNYTVYKEIKSYLARTGRSDLTVKMATISPFQRQEVPQIDTSALRQEDNILEESPLDTRLRGVHRLLKVQYNSIDKDFAFAESFKFDKIDAGEAIPELDSDKEAEVVDSLNTAIDKYGFDPDRKQRKNPDRPFAERLLFAHEVDKWVQKNEDKQWREEHPYLAKVVKALYFLAAFSAGASGGSMSALDPKYWKLTE